MTRVLESECARRKIPYRIVGARKFYERMEVKDIVGTFFPGLSYIAHHRLQKWMTLIPQVAHAWEQFDFLNLILFLQLLNL
jgi:hypothetical protein